MSPVDLRARLADWLSCTRCGLHATRRKVVLGRGSVPAQLLFIGEAPGPSEDLIGEPFVGRAGVLLDKAITDACALARIATPPSYYITNVVGCLPVDEKGGKFREPTQEEALACWQRVELTARIVAPDHVVLLGNVAKHSLEGRFPAALMLRHPSYIVRQGGTASTEYRTFVRELSDLFAKATATRTLKPRDTFGDEIKKTARRVGK